MTKDGSKTKGLGLGRAEQLRTQKKKKKKELINESHSLINQQEDFDELISN